MQGWEQLLLGVIAVVLLIWFVPGVKAKLEQSKQAETDWPGLLIPIAAVVALVVFVMMLL